jgi:hypothetical protein
VGTSTHSNGFCAIWVCISSSSRRGKKWLVCLWGFADCASLRLLDMTRNVTAMPLTFGLGSKHARWRTWFLSEKKGGVCLFLPPPPGGAMDNVQNCPDKKKKNATGNQPATRPAPSKSCRLWLYGAWHLLKGARERRPWQLPRTWQTALLL